MEALCRICLMEAKSLVDLRTVTYGTNDKTYSEIYLECTSVYLRPEESSLICMQCKDRLQFAYDLRQQAIRSTDYLRNGEMIKVESDMYPTDDYKEDQKDEDEPETQMIKTEENLEAEMIYEQGAVLFQVSYQEKKRTNLKPDKIMRLRCKYCLQFHESSALKKQCEKEHLVSNGGMECDFCGKKFKETKSIARHINDMHLTSKSERKKFECDICHKILSQRGVLYYHKKFQHSQNPEVDLKSRVCQICGKGFNLTSALKRHLKRHEGIKDYTCDHCKNKFTTRSALKNHIQAIHLGLRLYHCQQCSKTFSQHSALIIHRSSVHSDQRKYICAICNKGFKRRSTLNVHQLLHTDEVKFVCNVCGMKFRYQTSLTSHLLVHEPNPVLFECEYCSTKFKRKQCLKKHTRKHTGQLLYCKLCGKGYPNKKSLEEHLVVYHEKKKYKCGCGKEFVNTSNRKRHMATCPSSFYTQEEINE